MKAFKSFTRKYEKDTIQENKCKKNNLSFLIVFFMLIILSSCMQAVQENITTDQAKFTPILVDNLGEKAKTHFEKNLKLAEYYAEKQLLIASTISYKSGMTEAYFMLGRIHRKQIGLDNALKYFHKAYILAEKANNEVIMAKITSGLGNTYSDLHMYEEAIPYYKKSIVLKEANQQGFTIGNNYLRLGIAYFHILQHKEALAYLKKAEQTFEDLEIIEGLAEVYYEIGKVQYELCNTNLAIATQHKSIDLSKSVADNTRLVYAYDQLTTIYLDKNDYGSAKRYAEKASELLRDNAFSKQEATVFCSVHNNLAKIYLAEKAYDKALKYLKINEEVQEVHPNEQEKELVLTYKLMAQIYAEKDLDFSSKYYASLATNLINTYQEKEEHNHTLKRQKLLAVDQAINDFKALYHSNASPTSWQKWNWVLILGVSMGSISILFFYRRKLWINSLFEEVGDKSNISPKQDKRIKFGMLNFIAVATRSRKNILAGITNTEIAQEKIGKDNKLSQTLISSSLDNNTVKEKYENQSLREAWPEITNIALLPESVEEEELFLRLVALHGLAFSKKWNAPEIFNESLNTYKLIFGADFGDNLQVISHYAKPLRIYEAQFESYVYWYDKRSYLSACMSLAYLKEAEDMQVYQEKLADYRALYGENFAENLQSFQEYYQLIEELNKKEEINQKYSNAN